MAIEILLKQGESERLEFKESLSDWDGILKTICAFLNTRGGKIVIGVDDQGNIRGIDIGKNTLPNIINRIKFSIEPIILPQIEITNLREKNLIVITVNEGVNKPYYYKGIAYRRIGASNQKLSGDELEKLILEKYRKRISFEDTEIGDNLSLIDEDIIKEFINSVRIERRLELKYRDKKDFLKRLGLIKDSNLTYASILCFSHNPQTYLPYAVVKCGRFKTLTKIVAEREIGGNIINQINLSLQFLRENLSFISKIDKMGRRIEIYEIPLEALREALVNAVCHRDYSIPSPIYVKIFDNRVVIMNPGKLLEPLTPEKLKGEHESILRNPRIGNILFLYGFIEKWGTGTNKIIETCITRGLKEPDFVEEGFFFKVIFYRKEVEGLMEEILKKLEGEMDILLENLLLKV